jgi:hypothetical protein
MNLGPIAGLLGATLASLSVFKWILAGFLGLMLLWIFSNSKDTKQSIHSRTIKDLVRSASQWQVRANQDSNPVVALMNSNYAVAYLNVVRSMGTDKDIEKITGMPMESFIDGVEATQTNSLQKFAGVCPNVAPKGLALASATGNWLK